MFVHRLNNIIIPHRNHARFCADLVNVWGNDKFGMPDIPLADLVWGIADHDRGYDEFDTVDLIGIKQDQQLRIQNRELYLQKSLARRNINVLADLISLRHVQTLCGELTDYESEIATLIADNKKMHGIVLDLDHVQTITNFLDNLSFDASIGDAAQKNFAVYDFLKGALVEVRYEIKERSILVAPWPFKCEKFTLPLYGYARQGYPNDIQLQLINYTFCCSA